MRVILMLLGVCEVWGAFAARNGSRYAFYRSMGSGKGAGSTRRVFGGGAVPLDAWGAVCALLDRYWAPRCSGAVVAPRWALTAAHCVSPRLAYVKYNARHPSGATEGQVAPVHYLYRHPGYKVVQEDEGRGMDVTLLHHDVGLVRTRADMLLASPPPVPSVVGMNLYDLLDLNDKQVDVLGFGRTEAGAQGESLFAARLVVAGCERAAWRHCVCGAAARGAASAGVCAGDSGGPVVFRGAQVAVTSMGPLECASGGVTPPAPPATSVFTALRRYAPLVNATIHDADKALQMSRLSRASDLTAARTRLLACLTPLLLWLT